MHLNLGYIAILKENYQEAERILKHAIAVDPDYILAYEKLVLLSQKEMILGLLSYIVP